MNGNAKGRFSMLRGTRKVQNDIDVFFDTVSDATDVFGRLLRIYLQESDTNENFDRSLKQLTELELRADELRRGIESYLYEKTLIPDLRGDVLAMIEDVDSLISTQQALSFALKIEQPVIPEQFHQGFLNLERTTERCVSHLLSGARAFFRNIDEVRDHTHKVIFTETEADQICTELKTAIFASDLEKIEKIHLRYFIERIDLVANKAEDIADALTIYSLKRMV